MVKPLVTSALLVALALSAGSATSLAGRNEESAIPNSLVGRWSRTVTHATWLKYGRDFPTTTVTLVVDSSGTRVGYFGPDFNPSTAPSPGAANPDWYTDWRVTGRSLTIGAVPPCGWVDSWKGTYRWTVTGRTLVIAKVTEKCRDRLAIFAGTWKKR